MPDSSHPPAGSAQAGGRPDRIGSYRILDVLGEGGMGTVYLAEQREPIQREVALKVIKLGMDSLAVLARFEQERQALALMDHAGIAKVFDCGTTERGQPYFVMERVKGVPLDQFCETQELSLTRRLELMQQVCAAVQHAHQKGVVHRDLKPGNVLVSEENGRLQVKVIDFGLAKAMGQKLVEATLFTEAGQIVGTPEYMAPEQADPTNQDIDTRADIYSIGVMLYQVLVGELPFSACELRQAGLLEAQRILREVDPPKPSTRLSSSGDASTTIARARKVSVGALHKALKTDLDWVVFKAIDKERGRRYDTANALSADLQRYMDHEPLLAGPPSTAYRLQKLVRRYRAQFAAGGLVFLALIGGGVATFVQYLRAEDNARVAAQNADAARANEQLAERRAAENAALAAAEARAKDEALANQRRFEVKSDELAQTVREFDQLAGVPRYDTALAKVVELFPAWPDQAEALERWVEEDCGGLLGMREELAATVARLRGRALAWSEAQQRADREAHPRYTEWVAAERTLASLRRAHAIRTQERELLLPSLSPEQWARHASRLQWEAIDRVHPRAEQRAVWGEEALGLALAIVAVEKAKGSGREHEVLNTLAWAYLANGRDEEANQASERALQAAPREAESKYQGLREQVEAATARAAEKLRDLEAAQAALAAEVTKQRTWRFPDENEAERFLHDALVGLLEKLDGLEAVQKPEMERRLRWAQSVGPLTRAHPEARVTWTAVREQLAQSAKYAGAVVELREEDVWGLVPLGANPVTGYFEFYHLRSAWDGQSDPALIPIPRHDPETGHIAVGDETGMVFVLLPGGTMTLGSQAEGPEGPFYDAQSDTNESLNQVALDPFFLARHELTQGQWLRLAEGGMDAAPSQYGPGFALPVTLAHPVERVDWAMCDTLLGRHGMVLPTEAQWEYGCRGGTQTVWWSGSQVKDLRSVANLLDARTHEATSWSGEFVPWDDGSVIHAPVGRLAANGFGLHDVHGNVAEWCRDLYGKEQQTLRHGDGLRLRHQSGGFRSYRGGGFETEPRGVRSAAREFSAPAFRVPGLGVRGARAVRRAP